MRIEESLTITFDESLPENKSSSSIEDDRFEEPIVQDLSGSLQVNVSDEDTPFNFVYFLAMRMDGMEFNKDPILFAKIITTIVKFIKNDNPEDDSRVMEVDDVFPMFVPFTMDSI
nr:hypothetical protein [Tanacetum cinerariifolium]